MIRKLIMLLASASCIFQPNIKASGISDGVFYAVKWAQRAAIDKNDPFVNMIKEIKSNEDDELSACFESLSDSEVIKCIFDYVDRLSQDIKAIHRSYSYSSAKISKEFFKKYTLNEERDFDPAATERLIEDFKTLSRHDQQIIMASFVNNDVFFGSPIRVKSIVDVGELFDLVNPQADPDEREGAYTPLKGGRIILLCQLLFATVLIDENTSAELLEELYSSEAFKNLVRNEVGSYLRSQN